MWCTVGFFESLKRSFTLHRRKYEDQEFLKPNLRMKATSRTRSHSIAEGDSPPAPSNRDSMTGNRASMTSSKDSMTSSVDSMTNNYGSTTSSRDSMTSNTSLTGPSQRGTPPGSFSSFYSASLAPSRGSDASLSATTSTSKVIISQIQLHFLILVTNLREKVPAYLSVPSGLSEWIAFEFKCSFCKVDVQIL